MSNYRVQVPRLFRYGLQNFWRNIGLSIATTFVMVLTLLMIGTLVSLNLVANDAISSVEERIDITVYLDPVLTEVQVIELQAEIEQFTEVSSVKYITKEAALDIFTEAHVGNEIISASLEELSDNPLEASLVVNATRTDSYEELSKRLENHALASFFTRITYEDNRDIIQRLEKTTSWARIAGITISGIFAVIALLVIYNTVRLTIFSRREEISIMKLVGATNSFIRAPFLIEGTLYGLVAALISFIVLYPFLRGLSPKITEFIGAQSEMSFTFFASNFILLLGLMLVIGMVIGIISSAVAIKRYLRKIS
ncbi:cell division protein FtsX [Patescibacteria group bacterium]